jgi:hypothetical protein
MWTPHHVVIVNQTFVRERFGEENPIGRQLRFSDFETLSDWPRDPYFRIVGVVSDGKIRVCRTRPDPKSTFPEL